VNGTLNRISGYLKGIAKGTTLAAQATVSAIDSNHNALDVTVRGTPALPADAATATLQGTGNNSLATLAGIVSASKAFVTETSAAAIKTACESILAKLSAGQAARAASLGVTLSTEDAAKVPSLGQALAGASSPVVLPSAQDVVAYAGASNKISVALATLPALTTGSATIGAVTGPSAAALALDATLTGGTAKAILRGGAKGATTAADVTTTSIDTDHTAADVALKAALPAGTNTIGAVTGPSAAALALDATLTGGTQVAIAKGAAAAGAAVSGNPVLTGGSDGTNARTLLTDTSGRQVAVGAAATGAAVAGAPVYVAGIDGGGLARPLLTSAAGNVQTAPAKGTSYSSAALEISKVVSATGCLVNKVRVQNINGSTRYVHIFNASALPANGTVPTVMFALTANSGGEVVFQIPTDRFSSGLVVASSSTQGTLTISATADFLISVDLFPANT
jgi:hypothetical protein